MAESKIHPADSSHRDPSMETKVPPHEPLLSPKGHADPPIPQQLSIEMGREGSTQPLRTPSTTVPLRKRLQRIPHGCITCLRWSPEAKQWARRALMVRLPTAIIVFASLMLIGFLTQWQATSQDYIYDDQLDFSKTRVNPRDYMVDEIGANVTAGALQPAMELKPYDAGFPKDFNILLEPHLHTRYSDGRLTLAQAFSWALAMGFNAVVLSEHNNGFANAEAKRLLETDPRFRGKLLVIPGMEYTSCRIHMNFIGITVPATDSELDALPPPDREAMAFLIEMATERPYPSDAQLQRLIAVVHQLGGLVSVNHIPWSTASTPVPGGVDPTLRYHPTRAQLLQWGADFIEVVHTNKFDLVSAQFIENHRGQMGMLTGTDMHYPYPPHAWTILKSSNFSVEAVMQELRALRTSFLFDASGLPASSVLAGLNVEGTRNPDYDHVVALRALGDYLNTFYDYQRSMYSFQGDSCAPHFFRLHGLAVGMFVLLFLLLFIGFEVLFYGVCTYVPPLLLKCFRRGGTR